jgi:cardiolipin synthase
VFDMTISESIPTETKTERDDAETRERLENAVRASNGSAFVSGNSVTVLRNGVEIFPAMLDAVRSASTCIEFLTFVYWKGRVAEELALALSEKARQGVGVRVILDGFGSMPMRQELIDVMVDAGVDVERFRTPVRWKFWEADHRTHRKILVVDNRIAFTGGVGIAEEWEGDARDESEWRDTHFRIEGPAAMDLRAVFLTDWRDTGHPVARSDVLVSPPHAAGTVRMAVIDGSAQIGYSDAQRVMEGLIQSAEERVWIQTPYFNPSPELCGLMVDAVARGVDVQVLLPGPHIDKRISAVAAEDIYVDMIDKGVKVWVYQPTMMHVKAVLVDGHMSMVGSVNFNRRSVSKDEEVAIAVSDSEITTALERHFVDDRARSDLANPTVDRRWYRTIASKILKPLNPEM